MNARLVGHDAILIEVPTISIGPPCSPAQTERAIRGLIDGRYQWVVLTSVNAVIAVQEESQEFDLDTCSLAGAHIAAVSRRTAVAAHDLGTTPELLPDDTRQSATGIVDVLPEYIEDLDPASHVLLPRIDIGTDILTNGLTNPGWEVNDVIAYRTARAVPPSVDAHDTIKSGGFDAVYFTPGSTVKNLVSITGKPHAHTIIACIGLMAAVAAREYNLRVDVALGRASIPELVDALAEHVAQLWATGQLPPPHKKRHRSRKTKG